MTNTGKPSFSHFRAILEYRAEWCLLAQSREDIKDERRTRIMATIVQHKNTSAHYVLIGTGFGAYKSQRPSFVGGNLFPHEEAGEIPVAAVCNNEGIIQWFYTDELTVIEIDGKPAREWLGNYSSSSSGEAEGVELEQCPACQTRVRVDEEECPSCGLRLL
jgi:hypothetical protein